MREGKEGGWGLRQATFGIGDRNKSNLDEVTKKPK